MTERISETFVHRPLRIALLGLLICSCVRAEAQTPKDSSSLKLSGYAEVYYSYDLSRPADNQRPDFLFNHTRTNEVAANLALVRAAYERSNVRAAVGLMAGTYAQYNLAAEPAGLQYLYEASIGVKLSRSRDLWLDAGVIPSHLGAESAIGGDCLTLTRSLMAESSPYYSSGAKLSYRPSERWLVAGYVLNGWQRMVRPDGFTKLSFGTQVQYAPQEGTLVNWSTFIGTDVPDSIGSTRLFSDLYATVEGDGHAMVLAFDFGLQQAYPGDDWDGWVSVAGIYRQRFAKRWWIVGRAEYFLDDRSVIIENADLIGASLGVDLELAANVAWRVEARVLGDTRERFMDASGDPTSTNAAFTTSLCVAF